MMRVTPRSSRRSTSRCTAAAVAGRSAVTRTLRGLEMLVSAGVVAPTMPKRAPVGPSVAISERPTSRPSVTGASMRPSASSRGAKPGSSEKSRLALRNGSSPKVSMKRRVKSGVESNSWLPKMWAS